MTVSHDRIKSLLEAGDVDTVIQEITPLFRIAIASVLGPSHPKGSDQGEDILNEALVKLLEDGLRRLHMALERTANDKQFQAYLKVIAKNETINWLRREQKMSSVDLTELEHGGTDKPADDSGYRFEQLLCQWRHLVTSELIKQARSAHVSTNAFWRNELLGESCQVFVEFTLGMTAHRRKQTYSNLKAARAKATQLIQQLIGEQFDES